MDTDTKPRQNSDRPTPVRTPPVRLTAKGQVPAPAESKTESNYSLYQGLLQGLYDAVIVADLGGYIIDANKRAEEFLQYTVDELRSARAHELISGLSGEILGEIRQHLADGRFTVLDAQCIRKDGSGFPAEIAISRVDLSGAGNLVFSVRNIEWRKRTQEKLRTEHHALQSLASAVAITDLHGKLTYVNPAFVALWKYESEEHVIGRAIHHLWPADSVPMELLTAPHASETWIGEVTAIDALGKRHYLSATAAQNRDMHEMQTGMVFSFIDITEQKEAEDAIRREAEAQMSQASTQQNFSGSLNILAIADVFQLINSTNKSGTLSVCDGDQVEVAHVTFSEGEIANASYAELTGDDAVFKTLGSQASSFQFHQGQPAARESNITKSLMNFLLESAQNQDEAKGSRTSRA